MCRYTGLLAWLLAAAGCRHGGARDSTPAEAGSQSGSGDRSDTGRALVSASTACNQRLSPASTFKIPHALAALDAGVATGADQLFRHDGTPQPFPSVAARPHAGFRDD